ncbi:MAG TPA: bifunctional oligoribonuclease/PAP phosphatase NrnA [Gaiellaceae bacterium]|jgi:bifunctional oligoribonuclease and PAP phosphatase NrnA
MTTTKADLKAVAQGIRERDDFVLVTHESPDGDALGSILALKLALDQLGKRSTMFLAGSAPIPFEYRFMALDGLVREDPTELLGRPVLSVDAANEARLGSDQRLLKEAPFVAVIDHHHDNSRYGNVNIVVAEASSTSEVLRDIFSELKVRLTPEIAEALYIALVTDTGRFQYENTSPRTLRLAAELVEAGADAHRIFQHVYETIELSKLKLLALALQHVQVFEGGRLVISYLERSDFEEAGASSGASDGVVESLRAVAGVEMSALISEPPERGGRRISLRSSRDRLDVSEVARAAGGGGHRQAAGFSSDLSVEELIAFLRKEFVAKTSGEAR